TIAGRSCGGRSSVRPRIDHILNTRPNRLDAKLLKNGAPGEIRTPDLLLRRQSLYPAELRARIASVKCTSRDWPHQLKGIGKEILATVTVPGSSMPSVPAGRGALADYLPAAPATAATT